MIYTYWIRCVVVCKRRVLRAAAADGSRFTTATMNLNVRRIGIDNDSFTDEDGA
jgi:hypothetical protein